MEEETPRRGDEAKKRVVRLAGFSSFLPAIIASFRFFPLFLFSLLSQHHSNYHNASERSTGIFSFLILFRTGVTVISKRETIDWFTLESLVALLKKRQFYLFSDKKKNIYIFLIDIQKNCEPNLKNEWEKTFEK